MTNNVIDESTPKYYMYQEGTHLYSVSITCYGKCWSNCSEHELEHSISQVRNSRSINVCGCVVKYIVKPNPIQVSDKSIRICRRTKQHAVSPHDPLNANNSVS